MAFTRLLAIVGRQGAGKTLLRDALRREYERRGCRVAVLEAAGVPAGTDPVALARHHATDADVVLAEGFASARLPRIEVHRRATGGPLYDPAAPDAEGWIALLTDDRDLDVGCRVFRFHDTMWLQLLANLAWDRARVVG
jgi:molybdopterin-guanine dinucleotide biosynthesis protein